VKWAFGFPGELSADASPSIAGGRVFVGTQSGTVYALSAATGCVHWTFRADTAVRAAVTIARIENKGASCTRPSSATVLATSMLLTRQTGTLIWKAHLGRSSVRESHGIADLSRRTSLRRHRIGEETAGSTADYECCTFRGSLVALNAATGARIWKTYTITEEPSRRAKNKAGTQLGDRRARRSGRVRRSIRRRTSST
jgi:polyvinyl alcohol dehydrogenase (cytochrome)